MIVGKVAFLVVLVMQIVIRYPYRERSARNKAADRQ